LQLVPGATFLGESSGDEAGSVVAAGGDLDGDGLDDLLIGAVDAAYWAVRPGKAYVMLGRDGGWPTEIQLGDADASFRGVGDQDRASEALAGVGDVDGDGYDDLAVGAPRSDAVAQDSGQVYLIRGGSTGWAADTSLSDADASFLGEQLSEMAGRAVAGGGDLDGDGLDDLVIGAPYHDGAEEMSGKAWIVLGRTAGWAMDTPLADADATFEGQELDRLGFSLAVVGDVNGDGYDDLLAGTPYCQSIAYAAGGAWLLPGAPTDELGAFEDRATQFLGQEWGDYAGYALAAAGDVDGDGFDDLLVGAPGNGNYASDAGRTYLILGSADPWDSHRQLVNADVIFQGMAVADESGAAVAGGGDVDGDGRADLLIGASYVDSDEVDEGMAYLVRGAPEYPPGLQMLFNADGRVGGEAGGDHLGFAVALVGDADGDGLDDLLVGAPDTDEPFAGGGSAYLIFGITSTDGDGDGYSPWDHDCDDSDDSIHPEAEEVCADGIDSDCAGDLQQTEVDDDGDGYVECEGDCDDHNPHFHPGAEEVCDGYDTDCDGLLQEHLDPDGDGYDLCEHDCDDTDAGTFPGAPEACDGIDNDCDDVSDEGFDTDGDGFSSCTEGDCDDADRLVYPGAPEIPYDGIDQDCDGGDLIDVDGDGQPGGPRGSDCDDTRSWVYLGAAEECTDGIDADCDGRSDAEDPDCGLPGCGCGSAPVSPSPAAVLLLLSWLALGRTRNGA